MINTTETISGRKSAYDRDGFLIERGLFTKEEIASVAQEFMDLNAKGGVPGHYEPQKEGSYYAKKDNPLYKYPRVMHPHRFMKTAMDYLIDPRIMDILEELLGEEALTAQTMFYYKPAGSPGQAWHQDNFYLSVKPGSCIAAWIAVDKCNDENGCLQVVPNTQDIDLICPNMDADPDKSIAREIIPLNKIVRNMGATVGKELETPPESVQVVKAEMEPGDVLFFNGNVVHGSHNNVSKDRFRRSLINHYVHASSLELSRFYHPLYNRQGVVVSKEIASGGGPCGTAQGEVTQAH